MIHYKTSGTCASEIRFEIQEDKITDIEFVSGCPGNLLGIQSLVQGLTIDEVIERLDGIPCGRKSTSCPINSQKLYKSTKKHRQVNFSNLLSFNSPFT